MRDVPPPPLDFNTGGWAYEYEYRLVPGWFGMRLEERIAYEDGRREWIRCNRPVALMGREALLREINDAVSRNALRVTCR